MADLDREWPPAGQRSVPAARIDDLIITGATDDLIVYDRTAHHIHHLNGTSAAIWQLCDGHRTVPEIVVAVGAGLGTNVDQAVVELALAQLAEADLLAAPLVQRMPVESRRRLLRRMAGAGLVAVPAIVSLTAPTAAAVGASCPGCPAGTACCSGTCCYDGTCCSDGGCCQSGACCNGTCCHGGTCCNDGSCCHNGPCCGDTCCDGSACCGGTTCCNTLVGFVCCGDGRCLDPGSTC